jgi:DNA-binding beta-propeller fold protein YncE
VSCGELRSTVFIEEEVTMKGQRHSGECAWLAAVVAALCLAGVARAADLELVKKIDLKGKAGGLDHLALDAKRDRLFLANKVNNTLDVVDLKEGKLLKQVPNQQGVQGIAYSPELDRVYVGLGIKGFCNIFEGENYKLLDSVKFEDDADNVRYNPKTKLVYVAHAVKSIGVIDGKSFDLKADIKLPGTAEGFQIETGRSRMYVNIPTPSMVAVVDTDKNEVIAKHDVKLGAEAHPLALDEANHRMFVGCRKKETLKPAVVVMDTETGKEITSVEIPDGIDDLFYDAKRKKLYASCGEGFLVVIKQIDADRYEVSEKVATVKGAKTSYFAPERDRIYLGVPRQEGKDGPEIHVYQVKG